MARALPRRAACISTAAAACAEAVVTRCLMAGVPEIGVSVMHVDDETVHTHQLASFVLAIDCRPC